MHVRGQISTAARLRERARADLAGWTARPVPPRTPMEGRWVRLEPFSVAAHAGDLFAAFADDREGDLWRYRDVGPFAEEEAFFSYAEARMTGDDPLFFAIVDRSSGHALGSAAFMRITPRHGVIEVGSITYAPRLKRTRLASEAMYLMARRAFDELGYRRYEWKCDDLNEPSKRAARRLGFTFEGVFRNHMVVKGHNRDTAWFAIIDDDWPVVRSALEQWLAPDNFDEAGRQKVSLSALTNRRGRVA
jgi:RimJ/RimL family protein N-acetyltransferase